MVYVHLVYIFLVSLVLLFHQIRGHALYQKVMVLALPFVKIKQIKALPNLQSSLAALRLLDEFLACLES